MSPDRPTRSLRLATFALLAAFAATAFSGTAPEQVRNQVPVTILKIGPYDFRTVVLGGTDCIAGAGAAANCDVKVELLTIEGTSRPYCLATAPFVKPTFSPGERTKRIVWTLRPQNTGIGTFQFHRNNGILIVTPKVASHITELKWIGSDQFSGQANNVRDGNQKGDSSYVPVVIWAYQNSAGDKVEELCGAVDPRIVNN